MQVEMSDKLEYVLQVHAQETIFGEKKYNYCRWKSMAQHKSQGFSFQSEKSRRREACNWSSEQRNSEKKRKRKCQTTTPKEDVVYVRLQMANVHSAIRAHSNMILTRKAKGRDDLVHFVRQVQRTKIRKVIRKVVMTEMQKKRTKIQW